MSNVNIVLIDYLQEKLQTAHNLLKENEFEDVVVEVESNLRIALEILRSISLIKSHERE